MDSDPSRLFHWAGQPAKAQVHVDRLLRQPGARQRNHRFGTGQKFLCTVTWPTWWCIRTSNALSTIQFAVERLKVKHVMVVGHYGCSGVQAALEGARIGLADNWLRHIQDVRDRHRDILDAIPDHGKAAALCELNVIEQVINVAQSTVLQDAWAAGQEVTSAWLGVRRARRPGAGPAHDGGPRGQP